MQAHEEKAYKSVFLRFQVANSVVFDQVSKETLRCIFRKHGFTERMFKTCVSEIVKLLSNSLFLCRYKLNLIFFG